MPIYEYECEKCHETFEELQSIHEPPIAKCPACKGKARRMISTPSILFKGSGFHVTDYTSKKETGKSSEPASSEKSKTETPSADKPVKKSKSNNKKEGG